MKTYRVQKLVLDAFVGPRPAGAVARHLNDIGIDNRLVNLAWGTASENMRDCATNGNHHNAKKTHCKRGHAFTPENTGPNNRPEWRVCLECKRAKARERYRANMIEAQR